MYDYDEGTESLLLLVVLPSCFSGRWNNISILDTSGNYEKRATTNIMDNYGEIKTISKLPSTLVCLA